MERENIENSLKGQIKVLNDAKSIVDNYLVEFQEIEKELNEDVYRSDNGSYSYAIRYDKVLVDELSKKLNKSLKHLKRLKKFAEKEVPLVDMVPRPWGIPETTA